MFLGGYAQEERLDSLDTPKLGTSTLTFWCVQGSHV